MRLSPGTHLGPYEVIAPLGAGGMGEVYRAKDTRLGRDVAIKVLPQHLSENPDIHARFEREARTISSLNHPNICTLHDIGREGDIEYLVMELVDGETLAQRLERGPIPTAELIRLGVQIADALDRAHRAGIVHRDFKPGNVMLTKSGAKLMDFGLARNTPMPNATSGSGVTIAQLTQSPTVASPLTQEGSLVGTFLYMAPEQLEGREADARSDIWALGCVLYEMATGKRAFEGKSQASLIGAIMHSDPPPLSVVAPMAGPALDGLVRACLAKDPDERVQTAHDVKLQLSWMALSGSQSGIAAPALPQRRRRREPIAWGVAALAILAAAFFAWRGMAAANKPTQQVRFIIPVPGSIATLDMPRVSPDGKMVAFSAQDSSGRVMVWTRPFNSLTANPLPGTDHSGRPFWSPDSRSLAFIADGKLKKIMVAGGPPQVICDAPNGFDGSWGSSDVILFDGRADSDPILRVNASGGVATPAMPADSIGVGWPTFLPDGKHYFYTAIPTSGPPRILVGKLGEPRGKPLGITGSRVEYSPDGYLMFARDRTLMAQRFNAGSLKLEGEAFPVAEDLPVTVSAQANFTISQTGVLVYRATGTVMSRLVWLDRTGREIGEAAGPADYRAPDLSPDGSRIAIRRIAESGNADIWIIDPARGTSTRFTFDPGIDTNPLWSRDGSQIVWTSDRGGAEGLWAKASSGLGAEELLVRNDIAPTALDWTPDGKTILMSSFTSANGVDLYTLPAVGEHKPQVLVRTPFFDYRGRYSPDARWIAYESDESGRSEVYVASYQGAPGKWQISSNGGTDPRWSPDGKELFYLAGDQRLMSVAVTPGATFTPGTPRELFRARTEGGRRRNVYCVAPDGKRFLFLMPVGEANTPMTAVLNWREGTSRR